MQVTKCMAFIASKSWQHQLYQPLCKNLNRPKQKITFIDSSILKSNKIWSHVTINYYYICLKRFLHRLPFDSTKIKNKRMKNLIKRIFGNPDLPKIDIQYLEKVASFDNEEAKSLLDNYGFKFSRYAEPTQNKKGKYEYVRKSNPIEGVGNFPELIEIHEINLYKRLISYRLECDDSQNEVFLKHHFENLKKFTLSGYKPDLQQQGRFIKEKSSFEKFFLDELSGKLKSGKNMFAINIYFLNEIETQADLLDQQMSKHAIKRDYWKP